MLWVLFAILLLFVLFLFLVFPTLRRLPHREILRNQFIALRGLLGGDRPEYSLSAYAAAIKAGYTIETDVHLTADDVLVLLHDSTLDRTSDAVEYFGEENQTREFKTTTVYPAGNSMRADVKAQTL